MTTLTVNDPVFADLKVGANIGTLQMLVTELNKVPGFADALSPEQIQELKQ